MPGISDKNSSPEWLKYLFLLGVGVFLYLFLFKFPATPFFGDSDQSIFLYEAERMFNGEVMYRDFFEFTLPGTQALYAFLFSIFGLSYWIVGAATLVVGVATAFLLLRISERILPSPLYFLPALVYVFFGFRWFGLDGSHRMFSPVFILLAIWLLMQGKGLGRMAVIGLVLAIASFFTQQRGFVVVAALIVYLFVERIWTNEKWSQFFLRQAVLGSSFLFFLTAFCLYFVLAAGVDNFFYATFTYPSKFYRYGHPNNFSVYFIDLRKAFTINTVSDLLEIGPVILHAIILPFINPLLLLIAVFYRKRIDWNTWRFPFLLALVGLFLTLSTTAPNQFRLFQIAGPGLIVAVWLFSRLELSSERKRLLTYAVSAVLLLLGAFQAIRMQTNWEMVYLDTPSGRLAIVASPQAERYKWLLERVSPGDYFFEVYEPFVYFPLRLKNPTRFGQIWPNAYTQPDQIAEVIRDLDAKRPKMILWDNAYLPSDSPKPWGDYTGPLADFVHQNYSPVGDIYNLDGRPVQVWEVKPR